MITFGVFYFAGHADCPYYARAELLGDKLAINLPDFKLHKIVKTHDEWEVRYLRVDYMSDIEDICFSQLKTVIYFIEWTPSVIFLGRAQPRLKILPMVFMI